METKERHIRSGSEARGRARRAFGPAYLAFITVGLVAVVLLATRATPWLAPPDPARQRITPQFTLTRGQLAAMVADLPQDIRERILAEPVAFLALMAEVLDQPAELLALVDRQHPLPADYAPSDLVPLARYPLSTMRGDLSLRAAIMPAVLAMVSQARAEGVSITFSSTYRSYQYQGTIYNNEVERYGREKADRESARPGTSQHQLGTAIDFGSISDGYEKTPEGQWVTRHAWEYGFSLSYPDGYEWLTGYRYESWHYRYITKPAALMQREYFDDVQQYLLLFLHDHLQELAESRQ
jgi:D-alanyl-D-alanine carboxypeptidase